MKLNDKLRTHCSNKLVEEDRMKRTLGFKVIEKLSDKKTKDKDDTAYLAGFQYDYLDCVKGYFNKSEAYLNSVIKIMEEKNTLLGIQAEDIRLMLDNRLSNKRKVKKEPNKLLRKLTDVSNFTKLGEGRLLDKLDIVESNKRVTKVVTSTAVQLIDGFFMTVVERNENVSVAGIEEFTLKRDLEELTFKILKSLNKVEDKDIKIVENRTKHLLVNILIEVDGRIRNIIELLRGSDIVYFLNRNKTKTDGKLLETDLNFIGSGNSVGQEANEVLLNKMFLITQRDISDKRKTKEIVDLIRLNDRAFIYLYHIIKELSIPSHMIEYTSSLNMYNSLTGEELHKSLYTHKDYHIPFYIPNLFPKLKGKMHKNINILRNVLVEQNIFRDEVVKSGKRLSDNTYSAVSRITNDRYSFINIIADKLPNNLNMMDINFSLLTFLFKGKITLEVNKENKNFLHEFFPEMIDNVTNSLIKAYQHKRFLNEYEYGSIERPSVYYVKDNVKETMIKNIRDRIRRFITNNAEDLVLHHHNKIHNYHEQEARLMQENDYNALLKVYKPIKNGHIESQTRELIKVMNKKYKK